jgi:large conductance mechanosensitive channel
MPPIGLLLGNTDFSDLSVILKKGADAVMEGDAVVSPAIAEVAIRYGAFINTVLDFLIVAFAIFMVIKGYNKLKKKEEEAPAAPPAPSKEETLLTEIRDLLKEKK